MNRRSFFGIFSGVVAAIAGLPNVVLGTPTKTYAPRKLAAVWTTEIVSDMEAYYHPDAEAELMHMLSEQIAKSIDNDIINITNVKTRI